MTTRNDAHSPSNLVPTDYCGGFGFSYGCAAMPTGFNMEKLRRLRAEGRIAENPSKGMCFHCGAYFIHGAAILHKPSNKFILIGWQCADKLDLLQSFHDAEYAEWRKNEAKRRAAAAKEQRFAKAFRADCERRGIDLEMLLDNGHPKVTNMVAKAKRYGGFASDKQADFAIKLAKQWLVLQAELQIDDDLRRAVYIARAWENTDDYEAGRPREHEIASSLCHKLFDWASLSDAQRALFLKVTGVVVPEEGPKVEAPTGRVLVEGEIVGIKEVEDFYSYNGGTIIKLVVKDDRGFKLYVSAPRAENPERGQRVRFKATLAQSNDDPTFAFGKRPSNYEVLSEED